MSKLEASLESLLGKNAMEAESGTRMACLDNLSLPLLWFGRQPSDHHASGSGWPGKWQSGSSKPRTSSLSSNTSNPTRLRPMAFHLKASPGFTPVWIWYKVKNKSRIYFPTAASGSSAIFHIFHLFQTAACSKLYYPCWCSNRMQHAEHIPCRQEWCRPLMYRQSSYKWALSPLSV